MKSVKFTKMQGAGNDYVYVSTFEQQIKNPTQLAIALSNRNFGIGSDGLVLIQPSTLADFKMQMFNADGSESEMCGNASRCIGKYVYDKGLTLKENISLETKAGIKHITLLEGNTQSRRVQVDMGAPILEAGLIPVHFSTSPVLNQPIVVDGKEWIVNCVSMGNPHAIIFTSDIDKLDLPKIGPLFETHPLFPRRTNTEFVEIADQSTLRMRVWERGAGETLACGTGACASAVAAILNGYAHRKVKVHLLGGSLDIEWRESNKHVYMTGNAVTVFEGIINI